MTRIMGKKEEIGVRIKTERGIRRTEERERTINKRDDGVKRDEGGGKGGSEEHEKRRLQV